jgi:hypothetical protein
LKRAEIDQGATEFPCIDVLPQFLFGQGGFFRPVEEEGRGVHHDINSPFLAFAELAMLLFMALFGVAAPLCHVLIMPGHQVIQEVLARLQQESDHQRRAFGVGEAFEVWSTIALGQREELREARGGHPWRFKRINPSRGNGVIPVHRGLDGGNGRSWGGVFEGGKSRALLACRHGEQGVKRLA